MAEESVDIPVTEEAQEAPEEEPVQEPVEEAEDPSEPEPKRKPGRPLGSKNKEPGKPRAKRAPKLVQIPVDSEEVIEIPEPSLPRAVPHSLPIPDDNALMLKLLRDQAQRRQQRKSDLWKSWFQ